MKKIIIIGAGLSGLYLAKRLEDKYDITILEARDRLGGRALTIEGHDLGPSWVWEHQPRILSLIKELELSIFDQYNKGDAIYQAHTTEHFSAPTQPSLRVKGGIGHLCETLKQRLQRSKLLLNHEVIACSYPNDDAVLVQTQKETFDADIVLNTLPPRVAANLAYTPLLKEEVLHALQAVPTWMGHVIKVVVVYEKPFWRDAGLSGFVFSHKGPLSEIHDATTSKEGALFGFSSAKNAQHVNKKTVIEQLSNLFGEKAQNYLKIYIQNWNQEKYSATAQDIASLSAHPEYGYGLSCFDDKVLFCSTESAFEHGGYLEGSLHSAHQIITKHRL
ncbi:MAG TPA: hypothetical protein ENK90_01485 [Epsilonproteobacteria bacterium]|nr:hypothetical protein [Campylobacterota bacterium]